MKKRYPSIANPFFDNVDIFDNIDTQICITLLKIISFDFISKNWVKITDDQLKLTSKFSKSSMEMQKMFIEVNTKARLRI